MNKKNFLFLTSLILILIGIFLSFIGFLFGGRVYGIVFSSDGLQVRSPQGFYGNSEPIWSEENMILEPFSAINLDISYADIQIKKGDQFALSYGNQSTSKISYEVHNNILNVTQINQNSKAQFSLFDFYALQEPYVILYIPQNAEIDDITIHSNSGNLRLENLNFSNLTVDNSHGNLTLDHLEGKEMTLTLYSGNIHAKSLVADALTIECTYGNITGKDIHTQKNYIKLYSGNCSMKDFNPEILELYSQYGNTELSLTTSSDKYRYDLVTDYGSIHMPGLNAGSSYHSPEDASQNQFIKIESNSGNIRIEDS